MLTAGICAFIVFANNLVGGHRLEETSQLTPLPETATEFETSPVDMEAAIRKLEALINAADQSSQIITPLDKSEENYMNTILLLDDIIEAVHDPKNAEVFLKANGLTKIVAPNIDTENTEMKSKLIILLKVLFDVAPVTTNAYIPTKILDVLIDIFEKDDVDLKAHSLDVLTQWMPGNPKIQTRIMKLRGLETFYNQIEKLDITGIKVLLNLFNKVLAEHLAARDEEQMTKIGPEKYHMYRRIGLVEIMSTPHVCNGFLNIFETLWSYNKDDNHDIIVTVSDLIKNLDTCINIYKGKTNAVSLFEELLKYVQDETRKDYFEKLEFNAKDFADILSNNIVKMKVYKDEL